MTAALILLLEMGASTATAPTPAYVPPDITWHAVEGMPTWEAIEGMPIWEAIE